MDADLLEWRWMKVGPGKRCNIMSTTDPERSRQRDHWQAIAEQLGLSADAEPQPSSSEPVLAQPAARSAQQEPIQAEPSGFAESSPPEMAEEPESIAEQLEREVDFGAGVDLEPAEATLDEPEERPRRGRRGRGDRSRSGRSTESSQESEGRPARRSRGRGRPPEPEEEPVSQIDDTPDEPPAPPRDVEDEDDDEIPSISDWNIPSWNELIASLYRPER
jgi:hypothetical protein